MWALLLFGTRFMRGYWGGFCVYLGLSFVGGLFCVGGGRWVLRMLFVDLGPLTSGIILGTSLTRRAAGDKVILANTIGRGPRVTRIVTINCNKLISNGRIGVCIGINSGIMFAGCSNARVGLSKRRCVVVHRSSVLTVVR